MNWILSLFLVTGLHSISLAQSYYIVYKPIAQDIKNGEWDNIDAHLDTMYRNYTDSLMVPFTLDKIGDELFEVQDFTRLLKYSKLMLEYDREKLNTKIPVTSNKKWDAHCKNLCRSRIYGWGHFYLATSYLAINEYDSCLVHLGESSIGNYTSLPRRYTYNLSAGMHLTMMRSICLEGKGETEKAREILVPYLFLDSFPEVQHFYTHADVINQYFKLLDSSTLNSTSTFDAKNIFRIEEIKKKKHGFHYSEYTESNDSIVLPSGWHTFQYTPNGNYIKVEESYVPIYVDPFYYLRLGDTKFELDTYLKQTAFCRRLE